MNAFYTLTQGRIVPQFVPRFRFATPTATKLYVVYLVMYQKAVMASSGTLSQPVPTSGWGR